MAKILVENISDIKYNVLPIERTYDSIGGLALDERVRDMYERKKYDLAPKTAEEAKARGQKSHNGLNTSTPRINVYPVNGSNIVSIDLVPTRYLIGQAMRDVVAEAKYSAEDINLMSPNMVNVSTLAPIRKDGQYYLLSQIKGKALGSGQVHTGLVAGNVDAKYLSHENPLVATLKNECSEELGLDLSYLNSTSFVFLVDERETGQINFASVAMNADINTILNSYEALTKRKINANEDLEVMALSRLPIAGLALVPLENGSQGLRNITTYKPAAEGLVETKEDRNVRPYTAATIDYLSKPENVRFFLDKAGIAGVL